MTQRLEKAFAEASKLPAGEQDTRATWILEELAGERSWDTSRTNPADRLAELVAEALFDSASDIGCVGRRTPPS